MSDNEEALWQRAAGLIPWGTQTNAKRPDPRLAGVQPRFIVRGQGCRIWAVDGEEYIDYRSSLGPIILGHAHPEVIDAVRRHLDLGVLFSMSSPLEVEVAERVRACVPCAEMVRFLKTGADANAACVRVARAHTGRHHVLICGYHGWHDTFAPDVGGATSPGVLDATAAYTHRVAYGDIAAAEAVCERFGDDLAGLMTVPYEFGGEPRPDFLASLRGLADRLGVPLIFDEVLTGFRLALAGGQGYFGVIPDLASFAKAIANGYPLSAFVGRREYMENLSGAFITTTYAGETFSLAAAKATLDILRSEPVHSTIWAMGQRLAAGFAEGIRESGLPAQVTGLAPAPAVRFQTGDASQDNEMRLIFHREMFRRGIFAAEPWILSYAHSPADVDHTVEAAWEALRVVGQLLG